MAPLLGAIPLFIPRGIDNRDEVIALDAVLATIRKHRFVQRGYTIRMVAGFAEVLERKDFLVAGVRFELTTFGLCYLTQPSLRVGLYLHPE